MGVCQQPQRPLLELGDGVFEVRSTKGDGHLGGDDFDQKIIDWMAEEFLKSQGIDLRKDRMALQRLKEAAEKAKCELSTTMQTNINLPFVTADQSGPKHLDLTLSRAKLEQLSEDLLERTIGPCKMALQDAKLTWSSRSSIYGYVTVLNCKQLSLVLCTSTRCTIG